MKKVYLDTSAFLKLFFDEDGRRSVEELITLANSAKVQIIISEWVINESIWAIERKVSRKRIQNGEAFKIINSIADTIGARTRVKTMVVYPISEEIVVNSRIVIVELHCNAADALHVFVASKSDCSNFVTADKELVALLRAGGLSMEATNVLDFDEMDRFFRVIGS